ncbi:hypothetical protein FBZ96_101995 [Bradyrhizobium stylosanthis]|uniref:Uncharacterized protein n=1 Tax=Bradyrhizobium stylosanthis TaxID=1803665 RepID=A0A560ECS9_9BRAD|nr:hypothetical protein [Bradyrhizobium stylosanthis]TWB07177.1 hypothetical protein FBZ96_101995 [Bradyrhizobium stylosanthis]
MVQRVSTVAFEGIEARAVDVQVQVAPGLPAFAKALTINPDLLSNTVAEFYNSDQSLEAISLFVLENLD